MNPFDIFIIIVIGFCLIRGLFRGLIKELSSILGVLSGFYGAYKYYSYLSQILLDFLSKWISNTLYINMISFAIIFCVVLGLVVILGIIIRYLLDIVFLGWVDRLFGVAFGFIKGSMIISIILIACTTFLPNNSFIPKSLLAPHITMISEVMVQIVSKDVRQKYYLQIKEFQESWKKHV